MQKNFKKLPVTALSGFLGSGKTSLIKHILSSNYGYKIALIVNDIGEINIDAELIKKSDLTKTSEKLVEMSNGCICCTLREDLLLEIEKLAISDKYDYLLIESSGVSEPMLIAQTFDYTDENNFCLNNLANIDIMVTNIDCSQFFQYFTKN